MTVCGVTAEFNPFHSGHEYLIKQARENGADAVICVMSGNFVQRGSFAIADKTPRAAAAVLCGADLVLELPSAFSCAPAPLFALGAVSLLASCGIVDALVFGSESGLLPDTRRDLADPDDLLENLASGMSYPAAMGKTRDPNDLLAIEYMRAAEKLNVDFDFVPVKRMGEGHDSPVFSNDGFCSASSLRELIRCEDWNTFSKFMPESAVKIFSALHNADALQTSHYPLDELWLNCMRNYQPKDLRVIQGVSEGLEHRIFSAAKNACGIEELAIAVKTKRYTMARIRRILLHALLGIKADEYSILPQYIRPLAANTAGLSLLKEMKKKSMLPIVQKSAHIKVLGENARVQFANECRRTDIYMLSLHGREHRRSGAEFRRSMVSVK